MSYPTEIKDTIRGRSYFQITFAGTTAFTITSKKTERAELESFRNYLIDRYNHVPIASNSISCVPVPQPTTVPTTKTISLINCPCCQKQISSQAASCPHCGQPITDNTLVSQPPQFNGVYRATLFSGMQEVYCPRCKSSNCSHYTETRVIPGKTKTTYKANLNPLKPFTLVDKKEKIIKKERTQEIDMFICNKCGHKFF